MGDGGAIVTNDASLAKRLRIFATMGLEVKYQHEVAG